MLFIPPSITSAVAIVRTIALTLFDTPKFEYSASATEFDCTIFPIPNAAMAANTAKSVPSHFHPIPFEI